VKAGKSSSRWPDFRSWGCSPGVDQTRESPHPTRGTPALDFAKETLTGDTLNGRSRHYAAGHQLLGLWCIPCGTNTHSVDSSAFTTDRPVDRVLYEDSKARAAVVQERGGDWTNVLDRKAAWRSTMGCGVRRRSSSPAIDGFLSSAQAGDAGSAGNLGSKLLADSSPPHPPRVADMAAGFLWRPCCCACSLGRSDEVPSARTSRDPDTPRAEGAEALDASLPVCLQLSVADSRPSLRGTCAPGARAGWPAARARSSPATSCALRRRVLMKPPAHGVSLLVWVLPGVLVIAGVGLIILVVQRVWRNAPPGRRR